VGRQLRPLAQPDLAAPACAESTTLSTVVLTPRGVQVAPRSAAPTSRHAAKRARVLRSAVYVAYRRRSATGAIQVATGLAERQGGR